MLKSHHLTPVESNFSRYINTYLLYLSVPELKWDIKEDEWGCICSLSIHKRL